MILFFMMLLQFKDNSKQGPEKLVALKIQ